jgi:hypothetical protein
VLDPHPLSPEPATQMESPRTFVSLYRAGLFLMFAGNLLAIVAFFSPWFDVFKLDDPTYPFPKRGYSPWMVIQSGQLDSLRVFSGAFLLFIVGMALSSLALALTRSARRRSQAIAIACSLAAVSLALMALAVPAIPFDLSFSWPFLDSTMVYGVYLAIAGFVSVLGGVAMLSAAGAREH